MNIYFIGNCLNSISDASYRLRVKLFSHAYVFGLFSGYFVFGDMFLVTLKEFFLFIFTNCVYASILNFYAFCFHSVLYCHSCACIHGQYIRNKSVSH